MPTLGPRGRRFPCREGRPRTAFTSRGLDSPRFPTRQAAIPERSTDFDCVRTICVVPLSRQSLLAESQLSNLHFKPCSGSWAGRT